jgi:hypothetical protein
VVVGDQYKTVLFKKISSRDQYKSVKKNQRKETTNQKAQTRCMHCVCVRALNTADEGGKIRPSMRGLYTSLPPVCTELLLTLLLLRGPSYISATCKRGGTREMRRQVKNEE